MNLDDKLARAQTTIEEALASYRGRIAIACSFGGATGMAILDMVIARDPSVPVF